MKIFFQRVLNYLQTKLLFVWSHTKFLYRLINYIVRDDLRDREKFMRMIKVESVLSSLSTFDSYLRSEIKYNPNKFNKKELAILETVRQELNSILEYNNVDLEELYS